MNKITNSERDDVQTDVDPRERARKAVIWILPFGAA